LIECAKLSQLNDIYTIEKQSFKNPWTKSQIKYDLQSKINSENWVYILEEKIIGYIFVYIIDEQFHLNNIAVHPNYLRNKIGKSLIQHIILRAKKRKVNIILLEVSINNIPAIRCYQSIGFVQVGLRKNYYAKDDDAALYDLEIN
tara:strand:+ start:360 stop:794 length:435 start_codon:yes stop_codon:yes gene_type:complete